MHSFGLAMLDVDGTLRDEVGWKPGALDLVSALADADVTVALCSGRAIDSLHRTAEELTAVTYLGAAGGSLVQRREPHGWFTVGQRYLDPEFVAWASAGAEHVALELWAYTDTGWLALRRTPRVDHDEEFTGASAEIADYAGRTDIVKLLAVDSRAHHEAFLGEFAAHADVALVPSYPGYLDIVPADSAQTKGGDLITADLGITWDDVLAVGDGENDLGMLSRAGAAMAMAPLRLAQLDPDDGRRTRRACADLTEVLAFLNG